MAQLLIRQLDEDVKDRLRRRARRHGRSMEAEARAILEAGLAGDGQPASAGLGSRIAALVAQLQLTPADYAALQDAMAETRTAPARSIDFDA